ncbi:putative phage abortive infection protein [Paenibacillus pasadenensis]|uniref:putative phage abortive infection protein n=1 Tax=Paenibacillus pasadenensis TaxID=217090 RepID=UPI0004111CF6|nr:putative phage abortive infection protein [Paenibacillus pasadenensis]
MFGAVNALFSGLAFAGIIYTIQMQRKELALQRDELVLQREEISKSTDELAGQKELMAKQQFDNTFFNLLSLHSQVLESLEYPDNIKGHQVFKKFHTKMRTRLTDNSIVTFKQVYEESNLAFDNFIKTTVTIVDFVKSQSSLTYTSKRQYLDFYKTQFGDHEKIFLFYYCHSYDVGLKYILHEYNFLEGIDESLFVDELKEFWAFDSKFKNLVISN